jgi:hypothetical protein
MSDLAPFVAIGIVLVILVLWLMRRDRARTAAAAQRLTALGFSSCPEERAAIIEKVEWLENNREYRYDIEHPMRASLGGKTAYYYWKSRRRQGEIVVTEELLVPLRRPSEAGLVLVVKPSSLPAGMGSRLVGSVATGAWDAQPDDLTRIEIPTDLTGTNLIGALGPAGASLHDLVDPGSLATLQGVGDCGAMTVTCRGEWCSLVSASARLPLDVPKLWSLVGSLPSR